MLLDDWAISYRGGFDQALNVALKLEEASTEARHRSIRYQVLDKVRYELYWVRMHAWMKILREYPSTNST